MSAILNRLVSGDGIRKTRLHNYRGEFVGLRRLPNLPRCMVEAVAFKLTGRRAEKPWLNYAAVAMLEQLIQPTWSVLEFGSGMSTLWLARRCKRVTSVESNRSWYEATERRLQRSNLWADCRYCPVERYGEFGELPATSFDLVIVDGVDRALESRRALELVKPGGFIFYDNSDVQDARHVAARDILLAGCEHVSTVNDFCPPGIQVCESMLFRAREH